MIWATVSSWSCFCWLYRASPSLAAKNIIQFWYWPSGDVHAWSFLLGAVLIMASCTVSLTSVRSSLGTLSDLIPWIYLSLPLYDHKGFELSHTCWPSDFPYFLQFKTLFRELKINDEIPESLRKSQVSLIIWPDSLQMKSPWGISKFFPLLLLFIP